MANDPDTERIIKAIDSLPTLPVVALQLGEVIHGRSVSVPQVAKVLRADPATSAKLLRLVNSPYFGIPGGVTDVERAIPFIGFNTLYQLVLSVSVLETLNLASDKFDPKALWLHSLTVGTAARELASDLRFGDQGACFTAGLLHDMGKIALAQIGELDHISHDRLGSKLARQWKFPATLATPIEQHHEIHRVDVRERLPTNLRTITEIVAAADYISADCVATFGGSVEAEDGETAFMPQVFARNGYTATQLVALRDRTKTALEQTKIFLQLLETKQAA